MCICVCLSEIRLNNSAIFSHGGNDAVYTLRRCCDPGFGPLEENEATKGAGILISSDLCITADGVLQTSKYIKTLVGNLRIRLRKPKV